MTNANGILTQSDLEAIERMIQRNNDDLAISIARGLERLDERFDASETRLNERIAELDSKIESQSK